MYRILELYLRTNHGVYGAEELLNPFYGDYFEHQGKVGLISQPNSPTPKECDQIFSQRLRLAKKHYGKIFFKVFPTSFRPESFLWLREKFSYVSHERRDTFEQVLSYLVSAGTSTWYESGGLKHAPRSIKAQYAHFKRIEGVIFSYYQLKEVVQPIAQFTYEDFLDKTPRQLLRAANLRGKFPSRSLVLTERQNRTPKLSLFSNQREIRKWYQDSSLVTLRP